MGQDGEQALEGLRETLGVGAFDRLAGLADLREAIAGARAVQAVGEGADFSQRLGVCELLAQLEEARVVLRQALAVLGDDLLEVQRPAPYLRSS